MTTFELLCKKYGRSAATTYDYNRYCGKSALFSFLRMMAQVIDLGTNYQGGFSCTKYRHQ